MARQNRTTIKFKLAFFSTLLVVFVALSGSYYILRAQKQTLIAEGNTSRIDTVKALRQVAREALLVDDDTGIVNYANLLRKALTISYAMVLNTDGKVRVHTDPLLIGKTLSDPASGQALAARSRETPLLQRLTLDDGREILDYSIPIVLGLTPPEYKGVARIGFDKKAIDLLLSDSLSKMTRQIIGAFVFALIIGLLGAIVLATLIAKPIESLRLGAKTIGEGKLNHRIEVNTHDELKDLADEFNLMAKKLGELDQMKQDFVSNVTHELRSPLTSIRGYLDLLIQGAAGPNTDLQRDYLSIIKNSSVRLARFIDNLLDVAKIEAHKLTLSPSPADLQQLAHEMEVLFKPQMDEKKIRFSNLIPKNIPLIFVDKDKFAEVTINLTSNAIKFTSEEGLVKFLAVEGPNYVEIHIEDTGAGIPKDMIGKLFNKFEQVKSSQGLARKQKGTGLGLAIVKGIVEAHGGRIWVESPAPSGKGSVFKFTVPKLTDELKQKYNLTHPS
jgi:signal transduction histidine kinase